MMLLRCTQKLLERLPTPDGSGKGKPGPSQQIRSLNPLPARSKPANALSTTALGDWYATILFTRPSHLILSVNEKSRLCLLLPARELSTLGTRFQTETAELLRRIGASEEEIEREVREMSPLTFASTKISSETGYVVNRSVLGSMNDFTRMVQVSLQLRDWDMVRDADLRDLSEQMCETPCSPLALHFPNKAALAILRDRDLLRNHDLLHEALTTVHFLSAEDLSLA